MRRLKVLTVVGTRPEVIKLSRVIAELESRMDHVLLHTGQNFDFELNEGLLDELGIRSPDHVLAVAESNPSIAIAKVIEGVDAVLERDPPDALLVYGDTNSCFAALPAKRRQIPIFHMEAGNRCFDQRVPEEINRRIIDHLSDINLAQTEHARRHLLAEGVRPETIFVTGSPMPEVVAHHRDGIERSDVLARLGLERGGYVLVSAHREENVDAPERMASILDALRALSAEFGRKVVVSTHPRTRRRLDALPPDLAAKRRGFDVEFLRPFGFRDWMRLQRDAFCVVSDSGTLTEEAALMGFPAVMLREAHERPEGMDAGVTVMSGLRAERVLQAVSLVVSQREACAPEWGAEQPPAAVSRQVSRVLVSYVDYVRRVIWQRP
ncbi:MAG: UDP-N-acetylglucosamine 2-epimerase (non-hydrolyzing) [Thermoanaerobaculia bacterium]